MAYSIFALEGAFFIGLFLLGTWPPTVENLTPTELGMIFLVTWLLFHTALRFQLRNRRVAAIKTAALLQAMLQTENITSDINSDALPNSHPITVFLDTYFFALRLSTREGDVKLSSIQNGQVIKVGSKDAFAYFEIKHRIMAAKNPGGYAFPMEVVTTLGSWLLLVVAEYRVLYL